MRSAPAVAAAPVPAKGIHHDAASPERVVHHAFAVIAYDAAAGRYRFRSYLTDGHDGDDPAEKE